VHAFSDPTSVPSAGAPRAVESSPHPSALIARERNGSPTIGVYVHIPWCASICPYCDFDKQAHDFRLVDVYVDALCRHITQTPRRAAHSLYFGGGTPSLLTPVRLERVIEACRVQFGDGIGREITVEANPSDVVAHKVAAYLSAGVTRLSIGIQSLDDAELRFLGRRHSADKAVRAVRAARDAGCRDIGVDLMYGLPTSTVSSVQATLARAIDLGPDHISCYALTVEERTPLGEQARLGQIALPEDDAVADQYAAIQESLEAAGYAQYELSNWALPGHASIHNLTYWRNAEYAGIGAGAAGSFMGARYRRTPHVRDYIAAAQAGDDAYVSVEPWTVSQMMRDTVMLGLRLAEGVSNAEFEDRFARSLTDYCGAGLDELLRAGLLVWTGDRLALDPRAYFVCNAVLSRILPSTESESAAARR